RLRGARPGAGRGATECVVTPSMSEGPGRVGGAIGLRIAPPAPPGPSLTLGVTRMFENASYLYFEDVNWGLLRLWGERRCLDVLDVGCGFATTSQYIEQRGNRVTGIESSVEAVEVARTRISRVVQRDLQDFDPALGAFD